MIRDEIFKEEKVRLSSHFHHNPANPLIGLKHQRSNGGRQAVFDFIQNGEPKL